MFAAVCSARGPMATTCADSRSVAPVSLPGTPTSIRCSGAATLASSASTIGALATTSSHRTVIGCGAGCWGSSGASTDDGTLTHAGSISVAEATISCHQPEHRVVGRQSPFIVVIVVRSRGDPTECPRGLRGPGSQSRMGCDGVPKRLGRGSRQQHPAALALLRFSTRRSADGVGRVALHLLISRPAS